MSRKRQKRSACTVYCLKKDCSRMYLLQFAKCITRCNQERIETSRKPSIKQKGHCSHEQESAISIQAGNLHGTYSELVVRCTGIGYHSFSTFEIFKTQIIDIGGVTIRKDPPGSCSSLESGPLFTSLLSEKREHHTTCSPKER